MLCKKEEKRPVVPCCWWNIDLLPADALRYLYDHHFGNAPVCEWINKSLAVQRAAVGWRSLEEYGKRMNWPVKQVPSLTPISTPENMVNWGGGRQAV
jgi:hypothetical protein